jgi:stage II sporulation protein P
MFIVLLIAGVGFGVAGTYTLDNPDGKKIAFSSLIEKAAGLNWKTVINAGLPVIKRVEAEEMPVRKTGQALVGNLLYYLTGVKINNPLNLLQQEIPLMAAVMPVTATDSLDEWLEPEEVTEPPVGDLTGAEFPPTVENKVYSNETLIALYNTHTSETYELTDGLTHLKGRAGGVAVATNELARVLQDTYKLKIAHVEKIHDTAYGKSYVESEKTVKTLLQENPGLQMVIDVHRDGLLPRERTLVRLGGQDTAKILLVVGTDARAAHPNWRKNLEFARLVAAKMDQFYPGLSRGIAIKDGRYNQQHHPRGLLVEIGSAKNSTDEAVRSARLFANVLVAVLNDINK